MFGLRKILFGDTVPTHLPEDVRAAIEQWQQSPAPDLQEPHFHTRYVAVDIATSGNNPDNDQVLGIAATSIHRNMIRSCDAIFLDLSTPTDEASLARALVAFLNFIGKSPLVTYHEPFVGVFLQRLMKSQLGVSLPQQWVDLAWLLPSMFEEKSHTVQPLDFWIDALAQESTEERRDAMENTLLLARIFQMLTVRAIAKGIDSSSRLLDESRASSFLRRTH